MKLSLGSAALGAALVIATSAQSPAPSPMSGGAMTGGAMSGAAANAPACTSKPLSVKLNTQNNSGEGGTASLCDSTQGLVVKTTVSGSPEGVAQPEHIHTGTCADLGGVKYPLQSVSNGSATSVVPNVTVADLQKGTFAINVHKSTADVKTYVACGNIVASK
jgi:Cu/Zn superoxide dismutase